MIIKIKAKHFHKSEGYWDNNCPLGLAIKEQLNVRRVIIGTETVTINEKRYEQNPYYSLSAFNIDSAEASTLHPQKIIRKIKILNYKK